VINGITDLKNAVKQAEMTSARKKECPMCTFESKFMICGECGLDNGYLEKVGQTGHIRIKIGNTLEESMANFNRAKENGSQCANCLLDVNDGECCNHMPKLEFFVLENEFNCLSNLAASIKQQEDCLQADVLVDLLVNLRGKMGNMIARFEKRMSNVDKMSLTEQKNINASCKRFAEQIRFVEERYLAVVQNLRNLASLGLDNNQVEMEIDQKALDEHPSTQDIIATTMQKIRAERVVKSRKEAMEAGAKSQREGMKKFAAQTQEGASTSRPRIVPAAVAQPAPAPVVPGNMPNPRHTAEHIAPIPEVRPNANAQAAQNAGIAAGNLPQQAIRFNFERYKSYNANDKILIADRKQNKPTDRMLVGNFDVEARNYVNIGVLRTNNRANFALARRLGELFIIGGMHGGNWLALVEVYDRERNYRREVARLITARTRCAALVYNNRLYVAGGYSGTYMRSVEVWDFEGAWREARPLRYARADAVLIEFGGKMFAMGGYNGKEYEERIEVYDEVNNQWSDYGYMRGSRAGFAATVFNTALGDRRIYIAGGWASSNDTLKTAKSFNPVSKEWREEPSMILKKKYTTLVTIKVNGNDDHILALRGNSENWDVVIYNEKFEPNAQGRHRQWRYIE